MKFHIPHQRLGSIVILAVAAFVSEKPQAREIVDMAGLKVVVPDHIDRIYTTNPWGEAILYTLAPEKIAGLNMNLTEEEKRFLSPEYCSLPVLGGWFGKCATGNIEEIVKAAPDIVLAVDSIDTLATSQSVRYMEQTGIPVVLVSVELMDMHKTYEFVGDLLGLEERAKTLGDYCYATINRTAMKAETIPVDKRPRVYYAEGPRGLSTEPCGSCHTQVLDLAGGVNVADIPIVAGYGHAEVSLEHIAAWNPEIIIASWEHGTGPGQFLRGAKDDPVWKLVDAIKDGQVYETPQYPFNWFDRPPSVNRIIGVKWLSNLLHPDVFPMDIRAETKEFYSLFYHCNLSEEDLDFLLDHAVRQR